MKILIDCLLDAEQWCSACDDGFSEPVIHCRHCHHHLPAWYFTLRGSCKYCRTALRGSTRSHANRHTREEIEAIVRRRPVHKSGLAKVGS
jgi:hypothetical protein